MEKMRLPIGIENYKEFMDKSYYYVDKTLLIKELLDDGGKVHLFTRPRRFGKTLTLHMIKTFFEQEIQSDGATRDNRFYFEGKKIQAAGEIYTSKIGKYPVISLSLKSAKQPNFHMAYESLVDEIIKEYVRHNYILNADFWTEEYRTRYDSLMNRRAEPVAYAKSLAFLSECLAKYHNTSAIILLDEYDVPLEHSFFAGFYEEMIGFLRSLFESALKTNDSLEFAVITGCLRISKESIFTGLNNLETNSILNHNFAEHFGFVPSETEAMLAYYEMNSRMEEVKQWYDGYLFGNTEVYNPWSVINYVKTALINKAAFPKPYWSNTSSNSIVRELVERADNTVQGELECLLKGGTIEKPIHEDITYEDIYQTQDNLWNFLFFTGYLKAVSQRISDETLYLTMQIPNAEIRSIYRGALKEWFDTALRQTDYHSFYHAVQEQDIHAMESFINSQLAFSISYYDQAENFYHGYLLGILNGIGGYRILSNREQGLGRPDLILRPNNPSNTTFIIEIKQVKKFVQRSSACEKALQQIAERGYALELLQEGYEKIVCYGICFCDKSCMIKTERYVSGMEKEQSDCTKNKSLS